MPSFSLKNTSCRFWILLSIFCQSPAFSQLSKVDSLRYVLKSSSSNKKSPEQLYQQRRLANLALDNVSKMDHEANEMDSCKVGHEEILDLMRGVNDSVSIAQLYCESGDHYIYFHGNGAAAHIAYLNAKSYCKDIRSRVGQTILSSLVLIYKRSGNFPKAIEYNLLLTDIFQKSGDKEGLAVSYRHLSELFIDQGRFDLALDYALKAYNISKEISPEYQRTNPFCYTIFSLCRAYMMKKDFINAHLRSNESIFIAKEIDDKWAETDAWDVKGQIYAVEKKHARAIECYTNAMNAKISVKDTMPGLVYVYGNLASTYHDLEKSEQAIYYATRSMVMSRMLQDNGQIHSMAGILAGSYERKNDFKSAYFYSVLYKDLSDSLYSAEKISAMEGLRLEDDFNKKEALENERQEKEKILTEEKQRKQKLITRAVIGGLALVALFAAFVFRSLRITRRQKKIIETKNLETEKQKDIIEAKNKDITDSINYARRIQQAKLPDKNDIYEELKHSFVLYKPKDIVSGDFYYFHKKEGLIFIASADCTGHGVPGAFMSIIGSEQLKDAVMQSSDPGTILKLLNKGIKVSLRQTDSDESTRDGMDIALCVIDTHTGLIRYAGANRPIYIIRKGQKELEEIKATKKAIGGLTADDQHFESHDLTLKNGDVFYLATDGYADTFNGKNGKKLTTKKFKQVLMEIQHKTMQEQEEYLEEFIENWKFGTEQVDDILVIGVRV
ncbi:MAG: SpoIIE family protein phosphatase [Bacteroidota bacterium]|nr:SpoIIE family protein phosphatase [Bacteroidota bacterium]